MRNFVTNLLFSGVAFFSIASNARAASTCEDAFEAAISVSESNDKQQTHQLTENIKKFRESVDLSSGKRLSGPEILRLSQILEPYLGQSGSERAALLAVEFSTNVISFPLAISSPKTYAIEVVREANAKLQIDSLIRSVVSYRSGITAPRRLEPEASKQNQLAKWMNTEERRLRGPEILELAEAIAKDLGLDKDDRKKFLSRAPTVIQEAAQNIPDVERQTPKSYAIKMIQLLQMKSALGVLVNFIVKPS